MYLTIHTTGKVCPGEPENKYFPGESHTRETTNLTKLESKMTEF
jgi:hypothetical protein